MPDITPADVLAAYYGSEGFPPGEAADRPTLGRVLSAAGTRLSDLFAPYQGNKGTGFLGGLTPPVPQAVGELGKTASDIAMLPGRAATGGYNVTPEVPGQYSDVDEARRQLNEAHAGRSAFDLASLMIGAPGGAGGVGSGVRSQLGEVPSFTERMDALKDAAFQRAQRGTATGDYGLGTARRTEPPPPAGSMEDASDRLMSSLRDTQRQLQEYKNPPAGPLLAPGETDVSFYSGGNEKAGGALAGIRAYHGSKTGFDTFDLRKSGASDPGLVGKAVYASPDAEAASHFAMSQHYGRGDAPNVRPIEFDLKNPFVINDGVLPDGRRLTDLHPGGITKETGAAINRELKAAGYDGVIFNTGGEPVQYAVFDPKAVKSALRPKPTTEMTPIGEQYVLPGAERASEASMAQRAADAPLKAEVPQKPPGGMFSDEGNQGSLFSGGNKRAGTLLALAERPDISMGDVLGPQMGVGSPYLRNPNAPLFDYARMGERVPTKQFGLTRTESTDVTPDFLKAGRASNIARVNRIVEQGIKEGGLDWHNMLPLLEEYTGELGSKAGPAAFNTYMDRVGATSPNSNVLQNFRTASYYDNLLREGRPLPEIKYKASTGNPYIPEGVIPYPYGNTAQALHVMNLNALREGGYPLSRPKPPSFAENMKGNYTPVAIDRHNLTLWGLGDREIPNLTGYRYLEDLQQQQAKRMGIDPAQYQAAGWLPYADSGAEPALKLFENRIRTTAEQAGLTKEQVLREFIRGKMRLR